MSWMQKLHETYESVAADPDRFENLPWPISHVVKKAHVEIVLDADGNLRRARKLGRLEAPTLIPATESSAGRTANTMAHPLCEELSYCAADLPDADSERFAAYIQQLKAWCDSPMSHPKIRAVLAYVSRKTVWVDLDHAQLFPMQIEDAKGKKTGVNTEKVFVRWRIEAIDDPCSGTWQDAALIASWTAYDASLNPRSGFCMATGQIMRLSQNHPRFVRSPSDGGKLISANDFSGLTFRGRFTEDKKDYEKQSCSVGFEVSQKAHSALRWLIARQGSRNGDQAIVSWAMSGADVPDPMADSYELLGIDAAHLSADAGDHSAGQAFALRLKKAIQGYLAKLAPQENVVVMGLDSATPGRMAISYYRELRGSEFLQRIEAWHAKCAWPQNFGAQRKFVGAPSPRDIAQAAYGQRLDEKLEKATRERLLPCIVDAAPIPLDLVVSTTRRAANRNVSERWEWEKCLGIACALFRGKYAERNYEMGLELNRNSRDYLYGRMLAIAEQIEARALYLADEKRETTAARLMQRFADRPASAWRTIELALAPYKTRLRSTRGPFLFAMEREMDEVAAAFQGDDFTRDTALSGEFLLGYHCQRQAMRSRHPSAEQDAPIGNETKPIEENSDAS